MISCPSKLLSKSRVREHEACSFALAFKNRKMVPVEEYIPHRPDVS
jgi:hypothetical protein